MRSITKKEKSNKLNQIILGVSLVIIMFFSVLGYSFQREDNSQTNKKIVYNGFDFSLQNGFWFLELGNHQFAFKYNPKEVQKIDSEIKYLNTYSEKPLYIYSEDNEAASEIYRNIFYDNRIVQRVQSACLNESCDDNSPIKTCSDNFILITVKNETNIIQNQSCVFIEGPLENLTQITDEFLFKILNID